MGKGARSLNLIRSDAVILAFARTLQVLALIYLPLGLYLGLESDDLRTEMIYLAAGAAMFLAGRWLQVRATRG
jgi:hypothetical protein